MANKFKGVAAQEVGGITVGKLIFLSSLILAVFLLMMTAYMGDHIARMPDMCVKSGVESIYRSKMDHCIEQRLLICAVILGFLVGVYQTFAAVIITTASKPPTMLLLGHAVCTLLLVVGAGLIVPVVVKNRVYFEHPHPAVKEEFDERRATLIAWMLIYLIDAVVCAFVAALYLFVRQKK